MSWPQREVARPACDARNLDWLKAQPGGRARFREIRRLGPNASRTKAALERDLATLAEHNLATEVSTA
jgi:hypothetical protein